MKQQKIQKNTRTQHFNIKDRSANGALCIFSNSISRERPMRRDVVSKAQHGIAIDATSTTHRQTCRLLLSPTGQIFEGIAPHGHGENWLQEEFEDSIWLVVHEEQDDTRDYSTTGGVLERVFQMDGAVSLVLFSCWLLCVFVVELIEKKIAKDGRHNNDAEI